MKYIEKNYSLFHHFEYFWIVIILGLGKNSISLKKEIPQIIPEMVCNYFTGSISALTILCKVFSQSSNRPTANLSSPTSSSNSRPLHVILRNLNDVPKQRSKMTGLPTPMSMEEAWMKPFRNLSPCRISIIWQPLHTELIYLV